MDIVLLNDAQTTGVKTTIIKAAITPNMLPKEVAITAKIIPQNRYSIAICLF